MIPDTGFPSLRPIHATRDLPRGILPSYDFIVCGAGSAGCVVAARLAESGEASVLLVEAGGDDASPAGFEPAHWTRNPGGVRGWEVTSEPGTYLNGRRLPLGMGRGLGSGSGIQALVWSRGHRSDWDHFAAEAADDGWGYGAALGHYRRIEDWQGTPDPLRRGLDGPVQVASSSASPLPLGRLTLDAARTLGIPRYDSPNGAMMEGPGGAAFTDLLLRRGRRDSVYRSYVHPLVARPNLTVLTDALVARLVFNGRTVVGVELVIDDVRVKIGARCETVLSMGALNTPKVLMQSGVGPEEELAMHGIPLVQALPGVGRNHQDPVVVPCSWEARQALPAMPGGCAATVFWKSDAQLDAPDLLQCQFAFPLPSPDAREAAPAGHGWTMLAGLARPRSRGRVQLSGPRPEDPLRIDTNALGEPQDMAAAVSAVELARELGNHPLLRDLAGREVAPLARDRRGMAQFIRRTALTLRDPVGTARLGRDAMSVVDASLRVYGVGRLRIADASILPRMPVGGTRAPCVVVGERAAELMRQAHGLSLYAPRAASAAAR